MTRKIILAVIFTTALVTNFSFSSPSSSKVASNPKNEEKYIVVCIGNGICKLCGGVQVLNGVTTICVGASCAGVGGYMCISFAKMASSKGGEVVDESSITIDYSSPEFKAQIDEAAYKADFIQQVNAQL
jgi:hypothetical protein